jgi:hypothetical protein
VKYCVTEPTVKVTAADQNPLAHGTSKQSARPDP